MICMYLSSISDGDGNFSVVVVADSHSWAAVPYKGNDVLSPWQYSHGPVYAFLTDAALAMDPNVVAAMVLLGIPQPEVHFRAKAITTWRHGVARVIRAHARTGREAPLIIGHRKAAAPPPPRLIRWAEAAPLYLV